MVCVSEKYLNNGSLQSHHITGRRSHCVPSDGTLPDSIHTQKKGGREGGIDQLSVPHVNLESIQTTITLTYRRRHVLPVNRANRIESKFKRTFDTTVTAENGDTYPSDVFADYGELGGF